MRLFNIVAFINRIFDLRMRADQVRLYSRPYKCKIAALVLPFCTSARIRYLHKIQIPNLLLLKPRLNIKENTIYS